VGKVDGDGIHALNAPTSLSTHTIHLWGALRPSAGGASSVQTSATTIRELFRLLQDTYPGMQPHIARGVAVSINGQIFRDQWDQPLPPGAEIYLLPRVPGG
jgi:sulfur-carrier protein